MLHHLANTHALIIKIQNRITKVERDLLQTMTSCFLSHYMATVERKKYYFVERG